MTLNVSETDPPTRLVITFGPGDVPVAEQSIVTFLVETHDQIVRLTVTHENLADETARGEISRDMITRLAEADATVNELAEPYEVSLQAVSKHLKVLEDDVLAELDEDTSTEMNNKGATS